MSLGEHGVGPAVWFKQVERWRYDT